ncbi:MAG TPA: hypothetical protein VHX42_00410 [Candidatus Babeliales bacterium]|jgi:hypothetical protein|nr:hypothetical protein [Candidatus Babeliales bacterium]
MARLRSVKAVRVLTFEEKTRVANLFMLLIEVNLEKGVTRKRRAPQSTKNKRTQCSSRSKHKPMQPCHMLCVNNTASRTCKFPVRDLFLQSFARIFMKRNHFIMGYCNDRYHHLNAH